MTDKKQGSGFGVTAERKSIYNEFESLRQLEIDVIQEQ